jgi:hypothetical protein
MDTVKIQNFLRNNPSAQFPRFTSLGAAECARLQTSIAERLGLDAQAEPLVILEALWPNARFIPDVDAEHGFDLCELALRLGLKSHGEVFVNWYRFDKIDRIGLSDLSEYFGDIWYPSVDDIDIFDENLNWFILVRHDGRISVLNPSQNATP